jgi:transcriptional regulator NrdR family protein
MLCPKCENGKAMVLDTRYSYDEVYRKRQCKECKYTFYTEETEVVDPIGMKYVWAANTRHRRANKKEDKVNEQC